jgi:hypothetical protein
LSRWPTQLDQIAKKAKLDRKVRFTSLAHLLTPAFLRETWGMMNQKAASGVDGESTEQFTSEMEERVEESANSSKQAPTERHRSDRSKYPKGRARAERGRWASPLSQTGCCSERWRILEAVFETDFLDCSFGFRPGRNPHHALRALRSQIVGKKVSHVFEADIRRYFTRIEHQWLRRMVAHRIADPVIL